MGPVSTVMSILTGVIISDSVRSMVTLFISLAKSHEPPSTPALLSRTLFARYHRRVERLGFAWANRIIY